MKIKISVGTERGNNFSDGGLVQKTSNLLHRHTARLKDGADDVK